MVEVGMRTTSSMPSKGQFIAVWWHNGKLWSEVLRWEKAQSLVVYTTDNDWANANIEFYERKCATYITG